MNRDAERLSGDPTRSDEGYFEAEVFAQADKK